MTTTITVEAHCNPDTTEVVIIHRRPEHGMYQFEQTVIQDGERFVCSVYDSHSIKIKEMSKNE